MVVPPLLAAPVGCTLVVLALATLSDPRLLDTWARQAKASFALVLLLTGVAWAGGQLVHGRLGGLVLVAQVLSLAALVLVGLAGRGAATGSA